MKKFGMVMAAMLMVVSLAACSNSVSGTPGTSSSTGYIEGNLGDKMSTAWFDFTVESATLYSEYNGNTPNEGYQFLVLDVALKNTFNEAVPMFDSDFDVEWDDPNSYELPLSMTVNGEELTEEEYELPYHGSADIAMLYEVPQGVEDFIVYFDEFFEDETEGDVFAVYFTPEQG